MDTDMKTLVFGVGLSRTGTTSLTVALRILGWKADHFPRRKDFDMGYYEGGTEWLQIEKDGMNAITDLPAAVFVEELANLYPHAKFVLTTRKLGKWLRSMKQLMAPQAKKIPQANWQVFFRAAAYRTLRYNEHTLRNSFYQHHRKVKNVIPAERLLELPLEISDSEKWKRLCGFLGVPVPDCSYPRKSVHFAENF
jgi:hypothetical protein